MIRKGRPAAGMRDAGGPRSDTGGRGSRRTGFGRASQSAAPAAKPSAETPPDIADRFEAFETPEAFEAHDQASASAAAKPHDPHAILRAAHPHEGEVAYSRSSDQRRARPDRTDKMQGRSLKARALGYLSRREYSRAELSRKLVPYVDAADALEGLLDSLEKEGWLSDTRFAESLIHRRAARLGAGRIVSELKRHAVGTALIEEASAQLRETELERARAVWQKKYGTLPDTPAERARQARFLAARGFSTAIIGKILKGIEDEWSGE